MRFKVLHDGGEVQEMLATLHVQRWHWLERLAEQALWVSVVFGALLVLYAACRICGIRMRSCGCIKRFLRWSGVDHFDDFEAVFIVHEVAYPSKSTEKLKLSVKLVAGDNAVETEQTTHGIFHHSLLLIVDQGTRCVDVCLCDGKGRTISKVPLDPIRDVLMLPEEELKERELRFQKEGSRKGLASLRDAKVRLSVLIRRPCSDGKPKPHEPEPGEASVELRYHMEKARRLAGPSADELAVLSCACAGPVELVQRGTLQTLRTWGRKRRVWVKAIGPPLSSQWLLGIWPNEEASHRGLDGSQELVLALADESTIIEADPVHSNIFDIQCKDPPSGRAGGAKTLRFTRLDRGRDVWVETLRTLVKKVREVPEVTAS